MHLMLICAPNVQPTSGMCSFWCTSHSLVVPSTFLQNMCQWPVCSFFGRMFEVHCQQKTSIMTTDDIIPICDIAVRLCSSWYMYYTRTKPARSNFYYCFTKLEYLVHTRALERCVDENATLLYQNMIAARKDYCHPRVCPSRIRQSRLLIDEEALTTMGKRCA